MTNEEAEELFPKWKWINGDPVKIETIEPKPGKCGCRVKSDWGTFQQSFDLRRECTADVTLKDADE